jgi:hypothetical protein
MNFVKTIATFLGLVVLAALLLSALAPKATHALVASLVQVTNTPSSPVPNKDVDSPAHATVAPLNCFVEADPNSGGLQCTLGVGGNSSYTVPAGQRLVVEQLSAFCQTISNGTIPFLEFSLTEAGTQAIVPLALTNKSNAYLVTQPVRYYADPGSMIAASASGPTGSFCEYYANGYLVSYP